MKATLAPVLLAISLSLLVTGCVSNRYKQAPKDVPPPQLLNIAFVPSPLGAELTSLITYNGPGSWKRDAFWDEYVVTFHNPGNQSLAVSSAALIDSTGTTWTAGNQPWALEKQSKTLEQQYKETGMAFVRHGGVTVTILGVGAAGIASAGVFSATAPLVAGATVVALPLYYLAVLSINKDNRKLMEMKFKQRRIELPLTLAPGETRTGSLFFPMVPSPRSLNLLWSYGPTTGESVLSLDFLKGLHLSEPTVLKPTAH